MDRHTAANYPLLPTITRHASEHSLKAAAVPYLIEAWLEDYWERVQSSDVVETGQAGCHYLFDVAQERLIAAWATSTGQHHEKRDAARMRSHPLGFGKRYHRGHAIPHSGGGPTDINLVPQLGSLNVGHFRVLERQFVAQPGSLYFTHWLYEDLSQKPAAVEQGLLVAGRAPDVMVFRN